MLEAFEIVEAKSDLASAFLTLLCDVFRAVPGDPDHYGGRINRRTRVYEGLPCRCQRARSPRQYIEGFQSVSITDWEVLLPVGTVVYPADIIKCNGSDYEVQGHDQGIEDALYLTVYATRLT